MRIIKNKLLLLGILCLFTACSTNRVIYMQKKQDSIQGIDTIPKLYDAKIKVKDMLTISVTCSQPETAAPFNLTVSAPTSVNSSTYYATSQPTLQIYQVNNDGDIYFPIIGKLHIVGMTKSELEKFLVLKLQKYIVDEIPTVIVRLIDYRYSVIGEVNRPGEFTSGSNKVNIFEALAQAGDMTIYGRRDNVKLIREDNEGRRNTIVLDLTQENITESPYYYLEQNDIIYVEPNKAKSRSSQVSSTTNVWLTVTSILVSVASLITTIILN